MKGISLNRNGFPYNSLERSKAEFFRSASLKYVAEKIAGNHNSEPRRILVTVHS